MIAFGEPVVYAGPSRVDEVGTANSRGEFMQNSVTEGWVGKAPDGYRNSEAKTETTIKSQNGKYTRWVEQDPDRIHIWRLAWDLLLSDKMTLEDICEELHTHGYRYRTGRPFVEVKSNGKSKGQQKYVISYLP